MSPPARLARRARRRYGVVTRADVHDAGLTDEWIEAGLANGTLRWLHPGVYAYAAQPDSWLHRVAAAVIAGGEGAFASHATAARIHGLEHVGRLDGPIEITVPRGYVPKVRGVKVHTTTAADVGTVTRHGIAMSSVERTLCEISPRLDGVAGVERAVDAAVAAGAARLRTLDTCRQEIGRFRGAALIRRIVELHDPQTALTRSEKERIFGRIVRGRGLPAFTPNFRVVLEGRVRFLDFALPEWLIAVEIDTERHHGSMLARGRDGKRQNTLVLAGWLVLRFAERDLLDHPERVIAEIVAALAARGVDVQVRPSYDG